MKALLIPAIALSLSFSQPLCGRSAKNLLKDVGRAVTQTDYSHLDEKIIEQLFRCNSACFGDAYSCRFDTATLLAAGEDPDFFFDDLSQLGSRVGGLYSGSPHGDISLVKRPPHKTVVGIVSAVVTMVDYEKETDQKIIRPLVDQARQLKKKHLNIEKWIRKNPYILAWQGRKGESLMHLAARSDSPAAMELLIKYGLDINTLDKDGNTPLHYALNYNAFFAAQFLMDQGADAHIKNNYRMNPIDIMLSTYHIEMSAFFIANINDIHTLDGKGNSYLHLAMAHYSKPMIKALVNAGLDINAKNNAGETPGLYAVKSYLATNGGQYPYFNQFLLSKALAGALQCGLDFDLADQEGHTIHDLLTEDMQFTLEMHTETTSNFGF